MGRNTNQKLTKQAPGLSYHRAGLLDVPLIFQLIQEGSESGSFSDAFIRRTGSVHLLGQILRSVVQQYFQPKQASARYEWQIFSLANGEAAGFYKLTKGVAPNLDCDLELLCVSPALRNQGIGAAVLDRVNAQVPHGARLVVHCTKYARAMQHLLKSRQLRRNVKFGVPQVEEYQSRGAAPTVR